MIGEYGCKSPALTPTFAPVDGMVMLTTSVLQMVLREPHPSSTRPPERCGVDGRGRESDEFGAVLEFLAVRARAFLGREDGWEAVHCIAQAGGGGVGLGGGWAQIDEPFLQCRRYWTFLIACRV